MNATLNNVHACLPLNAINDGSNKSRSAFRRNILVARGGRLPSGENKCWGEMSTDRISGVFTR